MKNEGLGKKSSKPVEVLLKRSGESYSEDKQCTTDRDTIKRILVRVGAICFSDSIGIRITWEEKSSSGEHKMSQISKLNSVRS